MAGIGSHHSLASLDTMGITAAVYPSEQQLWTTGPDINDPGDQGVSQNDPETLIQPPVPNSQAAVSQQEDFLEEVMNGQVSNGAYGEEWVNLQITEPAGYGAYNDQPFYSGHSQIVQANPASEQGWGVGPARRWAHFPFAELSNYARNPRIHLRNGALPWVTASSALYYRTQLAWEAQWDPYKQRNPVGPVVPVASTVPFVQTVPTYGGGFVNYPGLDTPVSDPAMGVY